MHWIGTQLLRLRHPLRGLWDALRYDRSYRTEVCIGGIVVGVCLYFGYPVTKTELLFLSLAWALLMITELQNSSIEVALDHLHPERHEEIRKSKDLAAGAVFTAALFFVCVVILVLFF